MTYTIFDFCFPPEHFYVYIYLNPNKSGDFFYEGYHFEHEPFYVGKGSNKRAQEHLTIARTDRKTHHVRLKRQIQEILSTNNIPIIAIIKSNIVDENEALETEANLMNLIGTQDKLSGPLLNYKASKGGRKGRKGSTFKKKKSPIPKGTKLFLTEQQRTLRSERLTTLKKNDVIQIRVTLKNNPNTNTKDLARAFNTNINAIYKIKSYITWKHVVI